MKICARRRGERLAVSARERGLDLRELRRETIHLGAVRVLGRMESSQRQPLGSSDKLPAVDGPMAKNQTRGRANWLAAHVSSTFPPETAGKLLGSVTRMTDPK